MNCVYIADLTINDPAILATLCLLHDRVLLPHPYDLDSDCERLFLWSFDQLRDLEYEQRRYRAWKTRYGELERGGVIQVLPAPLPAREAPGNLTALLSAHLSPGVRPSTLFGPSNALNGRAAIAVHALFSKSKDPEFAVGDDRDTSTMALRTKLARASLTCAAPLLPELANEQILELREATASVRAGFRDYLASLVDDVEARAGSASGDLNEAARRTFERKIEPDFDEFLRREIPDKVSWWSSVASAVATGVGDVLKVCAAPWAFNNYAKLANDGGDFLKSVSDRQLEQVSNRRLAFQFLANVAKR